LSYIFILAKIEHMLTQYITERQNIKRFDANAFTETKTSFQNL